MRIRLTHDLVPDDRFELQLFVEAVNLAPEHEDRNRAIQAGWDAVYQYRGKPVSR